MYARLYPKVYFEENKISPTLIGLSPLSTAHPRIFQHSTGSVLHASLTWRFNLAMDRSVGFVSTPRMTKTRYLRLAFTLAPQRNVA